MSLNDYYDLGYKDGLHGSYNPPHDSLVVEWVFGFSEREWAEKRAYNHGYEAGRKQRERGR